MTIDPGITVGSVDRSLGAVSPPTPPTAATPPSQGVQNTHTLKSQVTGLPTMDMACSCGVGGAVLVSVEQRKVAFHICVN